MVRVKKKKKHNAAQIAAYQWNWTGLSGPIRWTCI